MADDTHTITHLLKEWERGNSNALEQLLPLVYEQLRGMAQYQLSLERSDHTLQPTALVNEVLLRFLNQHKLEWHNRSHFMGTIAKVMRQVLVDYARRKCAEKRFPRHGRITLADAERLVVSDENLEEILSLDEALTRLAVIDERQAKVVELFYFVGLSLDDIVQTLNISLSTVKRELQFAKAWLFRELTKSEP